MQVVILAGGLGSRLSEETQARPKPMVEIGGRPILWHIMKIYSSYGFNDFIICLGYKGYVIKEYFNHFLLHESNVTLDLKEHSIQYHQKKSEPWKITLVDTGNDSMTGGRILRVRPYLEKNKSFLLTYGDGVSDINIKKLVESHKKSKARATVTAVIPPGRFGCLDIDQNNKVTDFKEKPPGDGTQINGGFFVFEHDIFSLIKSDSTILEKEPLQGLTKSRKLNAYQHSGFWYAMDTLRDKKHLEELWASGKAPWKVWKN